MRNRELLTQVLVVNLLLISAAVVAAAIAANPSANLAEHPLSALVFGIAIAITVLVNVLLLQRRFRPLERLVEEMERVDLSRPGANLRPPDSLKGPVEVERLQRAFGRMLERLEAERRRASSAALTAQEKERARIARDLHDEVNQSLTGLLLRLEATRRNAPPELAHELAETQTLANRAMEELLTLARQLRPTVLDDLGLKAAVAGHVDAIGRQTDIRTGLETEGTFQGLPEDVQLVAYRVAQEALSNAVRHSGATSIQVRLARENGALEVTVADDGGGFTFDQATTGLGLGGMRERALLLGGELKVESRPEVGTRVRLRVPIREHGAAGVQHSHFEPTDWLGSPPGPPTKPSPWR
jgi:two-component system sensor histidine kinase UhpB